MPIMQQQGYELPGGKLLMLLRASLALGYIPMSWRHVRVVFIHKPWKPLSQAKSLRPINLMSFILKILEKLLDRHIRGGVLVEKPLRQNQFAYRAGMCSEMALFQVDHIGYLPGNLTIPLFLLLSSLSESVDLRRPVVGG
jgi:hypothetical protein